jgi:hypothetical protein
VSFDVVSIGEVKTSGVGIGAITGQYSLQTSCRNLGDFGLRLFVAKEEKELEVSWENSER